MAAVVGVIATRALGRGFEGPKHMGCGLRTVLFVFFVGQLLGSPESLLPLELPELPGEDLDVV